MDRITRVAPIFYIETVLSMLLDIFLFQIKYSAMQFCGLVLVLGVFFSMIIYAYRREYKETSEGQK